jgi:hypothetical protein
MAVIAQGIVQDWRTERNDPLAKVESLLKEIAYLIVS